MTERQARELIERRRLRLVPYGLAWRIVGVGVDLLVRDLSVLSRADLESTA